jgi:F-type H+-transporting ATPase subunit epsilon
MEVVLVSPEAVLYTGEAKMVVVRTVGGGEIAFEDNHAQFLAALQSWPARVKFADGTQLVFAVHSGFVEVGNNKVTILSDVAEPTTEIDIERARRSKADAEEALRTNPDNPDAVAQLRRAETRLEACGLVA